MSTLAQPVSCAKCGAPLDVPEGASYVGCAYCGSRLAVKRNSSVVYTELLDRIEANTGQMAGDLRFLRLRQELEYIEERWREEEQSFQARRSELAARVRRAREANTGFERPMLLLAGGLIWGALVLTGNLPGVTVAGAALFLLIAVLDWRSAFSRQHRYEDLNIELQEAERAHSDAEDEYRRKRAHLQQQIAQTSTL
jgi:LSD1 subclass zinc finger protein